MDTKMVDVTLHLDEDLTHNDRDSLRNQLLEQDGVMAADYRDEKPHLMVIEYNPDKTNSSAFITLVQARGIHAELIGL